MKQGLHVCLYKRKGQPIITAYVVDDEAEISMPLDDFKAELIKEIDSVALTFRQETFQKRVDAAFGTIINGMKKGATTIL
jgi:hypothetical protein